MTSLLTNTASMSTLRLMTQTSKDITQTEAQASSGLRVASASDNAAYWSISTHLKSQINELSSINDGLNLANNVFKVADAALTDVHTNLDAINQDIVSAFQKGVDRTALQNDISSRQQAIISDVQDASFNGVNVIDDHYTVQYNGYTDQYGNGYLYRNGILDYQHDNQGDIVYTRNTDVLNYDFTKKILTGLNGKTSNFNGYNIITSETDKYSHGDPNKVITGGYDFINTHDYLTRDTASPDDIRSSAENIALRQSGNYFTLLDFVIDGRHSPLNIDNGIPQPVVATDEDLTIIQQKLQDAIQGITGVQSTIGSDMNRIANIQNFNGALSDALTSGVGSLQDADMNIVSTRLQALQTQQQLQTQSLSIANQNTSIILKLFA